MKTHQRFCALAALLLLAVGCKADKKGLNTTSAATDDSGLVCSAHGGYEERVCKASILRAVANPSSLDGRTIATLGFLVDIEGSTYLFPTKEFAATRDLSNAVACKGAGGDLSSAIGSYVTVFGKFSISRPMPSGFTAPAGTISVSEIRRSAYNPE